jgi:hypothetical protein
MAFFKYSLPSELVVDLESGNKLSFEKGIVDSIMVASKPGTQDGFVFVYARGWNSPFKTSLRFSYTLAEFQSITFSREAIGLSYYITLDEVNNTLHNWNLLSNSERTTYDEKATSLMSKGFMPFWRKEWNIEPGPASVIRLKRNGIVLVSGVNLNIPVTQNVTSTIVFEIDNIGNSVLNLTGTPLVSLSNPTEITVIQPTDSSLEPNQSISFGLSVTYSTTGTKNTIIAIASNDPLVPTFSIPTVFTVD